MLLSARLSYLYCSKYVSGYRRQPRSVVAYSAEGAHCVVLIRQSLPIECSCTGHLLSLTFFVYNCTLSIIKRNEIEMERRRVQWLMHLGVADATDVHPQEVTDSFIKSDECIDACLSNSSVIVIVCLHARNTSQHIVAFNNDDTALSRRRICTSLNNRLAHSLFYTE